MTIFNLGARKPTQIIHIADAARDARKYLKAALLYEKALRLVPEDAAIHIQCGHMFKEAGDLGRAEQHYQQAKQLTPDDPDLALQLGHFYKVAGRLQEAELAYRRAIDLDPDWPEPAIQLAELYRTGWRNHTKEAVRQQGLTVVDFTGRTRGEIAARCDLCLHAPSDSTPLIQQIHITASHIICGLVEDRLFSSYEWICMIDPECRYRPI
jgi:tetratricopeptide (TPR) repeat protein